MQTNPEFIKFERKGKLYFLNVTEIISYEERPFQSITVTFHNAIGLETLSFSVADEREYRAAQQIRKVLEKYVTAESESAVMQIEEQVTGEDNEQEE
jgi:hypothetical protein